MKTVSMIGVGRVGGALALALPAAGYAVRDLVRRGDVVETISSDIVFITTQDGEIAAAAAALVSHLRSMPIVYHTSGALSSEVLKPLADLGCPVGSVHPLVSVSGPESGPARFNGAYFCVEGEKVAVHEANNLVKALGGKPFSIETKFKSLYHAAAVTAAGHVVALFDAAVEMMTATGLDDDQAKKILLPLLRSAVDNLDHQSTADALTGTFARADVDTFVEHLRTLNLNVSDDLLEIYLLLAERSLHLASKQGVSKHRIDTMRAKVAIAKSKLK